MSDLAPFVAAVLRDKVVVDLQEELRVKTEKIQKLESELRVIRVTGRGGFPIYAERHYQHATEDPQDVDEWFLRLQNSTGDYVNTNLPSCPVQQIDSCELHIGGKEMIVLGDSDDFNGEPETEAGIHSRTYLFRELRASWLEVQIWT